MKAPAQLRIVLKRSWENSALRESRLLAAENAWPIVISIGRPSSRCVRMDLDTVKHHVDAWRRVTIGEVIWHPVRYRATDVEVDIPIGWKLSKPSEWIAACNDDSIRREFETMGTLVERTDSMFHSTFVRQRSLWRGRPVTEVIQAARLAMNLEPGSAAGRPLRTLSIEGIDTKFFERNDRLVTSLLDIRFDGEASKIGLETFLGAYLENDHWLLLMDLDGELLPFEKQRVRSSELRTSILPGRQLLIVENESCQHQLPTVPNTIAVLGAGFDLNWVLNPQFSKKRIGYWGDIDTWGLQFLAKARESVGQLEALMMSLDVFERFKDDFAVPEPVVASEDSPISLSQSEQVLYMQLLKESCGRLEQEFLSQELIRETILAWANG